MAIKSLADAFHEELQDMLSAEKQLVKALPKMAKKASSEQLRKAFEEHLEETRGHVERLEKAFEETGKTARAKKCEAMAGLIEEGEGIMQQQVDSEVLDALLIAAAQKVEHYEIASYGTLCTWADLLGYSNAKEQLSMTIEEEMSADKKLTSISESVNEAAMA